MSLRLWLYLSRTINPGQLEHKRASLDAKLRTSFSSGQQRRRTLGTVLPEPAWCNIEPLDNSSLHRLLSICRGLFTDKLRQWHRYGQMGEK